MVYKVISGTALKEKDPEVEGKYRLHSGDGELQGFCCKPGLEVSDPDKSFTIYCRDMIEILEVNKQKLALESESILDELRNKGINFSTPHHSNMVPLGLKFKQQLLVKGNIRNIWFYLKVK